MSDDDMSDWTPEQREEWRLEGLCSPLFDLFLRFDDAFGRLAIDKYDVSDEDAEAFAKRMETTDMGRAFAFFLRHIAAHRAIRATSHMVSAIWASRGKSEAISLANVRTEYDKLNRGDA